MRGADPGVVTRALDTDDPLPETRGFAGELPDGRLVRDVLGRVPLYTDGDEWSHRPHGLSDPTPLPAGHVRADGQIRRAWSLPDPDPTGDADAVRDAVGASLADVDDDGLAVAFSGGVDSALVASAVDAPLYVVGFPDSHDVAAAREAAAEMGRDLTVVELSLSDVERAVPEVARGIDRTNAMDVAIALPLYLVADRVAADGHDRLAVGQGADELFGGYAKVAKAPEDPRVEANTVRSARREVVRSLPEQASRDVLALRAAGVTPVAPFLDDRVVETALSLPGDALVSGDTRKVALRAAARDFVPDAVAARDKKAVQYGSLVSRELDRLARQAGFKRRMDDHVSKYVADRLCD
ncbi:MAG: asparagine synthase C-terminal domain-containing protein [Halobacteriaceae archaeon]